LRARLLVGPALAQHPLLACLQLLLLPNLKLRTIDRRAFLASLLMLFARLLPGALLLLLFVVVAAITAVALVLGKGWRCSRAGEEDGDYKFTHDSDFQKIPAM
jgi:hypothetical protein